jgi:hypothetical protein
MWMVAQFFAYSVHKATWRSQSSTLAKRPFSMKSKRNILLLLFSFVIARSASAQGTVNFLNDSITLSSPPDRLIRFAFADTPGNPFGTNNAAAVGTNFLVQLYYGASTAPESSLVAVSTPPARLRSSSTVQPGTWSGGGFRTLDGFYWGSDVLLQVRVWDFFDGATFEQAAATNPFGVRGKSEPFLFNIPVTGPGGAWRMGNFQGFVLSIPEPGAMALCFMGVVIAVLARRSG